MGAADRGERFLKASLRQSGDAFGVAFYWHTFTRVPFPVGSESLWAGWADALKPRPLLDVPSVDSVLNPMGKLLGCADSVVSRLSKRVSRAELAVILAALFGRRVVLSDFFGGDLNRTVLTDQGGDLLVAFSGFTKRVDFVADHSDECVEGKHLRP
jgi:hypothetical protein